MRPVFISDIDGTVANIEHRLHFIKEPHLTSGGYTPPWKPDWDCFFDACVNDTPIKETIELLRLLSRSGLSLLNSPQIIYITGRDERTRVATQQWLVTHGCPIGALYMRISGDHRPDDIIKSEILDNLIFYGLDPKNILGVFEDRDKVVKMWRSRGLKVYQCNEGNF